MGRLHDALEASGYSGHDLEVFLVRAVFCLFADDTGIFEPRDIFLDLLETWTREDGSDLGPALARLFQVLNTPVEQRQVKLDEDLARFPYVNGDLFAAKLNITDFDATMREALIDACRFDWAAISPAIFGALFQSVMDAAERRAQGAHYTTEKNILKVIEPLFLDDLRAEFERLQARKDNRRRTELKAFHKRLGEMKFFDPACGCGNFLIIAYRELRELEIELIRELRRGRADEAQRVLDTADLSRITVDQFYGIEIGEFPARIAETALWMMMHISRLGEELVLWSSQEFGFITLAEQYATGSSIMPQKRNPDFAEIGRGKTGRVYGHLMAILTTLKGLPLTYNRDLQEDKEGFFDTVDTLLSTLRVFVGMIETMTVHPTRMEDASQTGNMLATDLADYLVARGMPFREAHGILHSASRYAREHAKEVHQLSLEEYRRFSPLFDEDVLKITLEGSVASRDVPGGTAPRQVNAALQDARKLLETADEP